MLQAGVLAGVMGAEDSMRVVTSSVECWYSNVTHTTTIKFLIAPSLLAHYRVGHVKVKTNRVMVTALLIACLLLSHTILLYTRHTMNWCALASVFTQYFPILLA